jgi:hypothetical protein
LFLFIYRSSESSTEAQEEKLSASCFPLLIRDEDCGARAHDATAKPGKFITMMYQKSIAVSYAPQASAPIYHRTLKEICIVRRNCEFIIVRRTRARLAVVPKIILLFNTAAIFHQLFNE